MRILLAAVAIVAAAVLVVLLRTTSTRRIDALNPATPSSSATAYELAAESRARQPIAHDALARESLPDQVQAHADSDYRPRPAKPEATIIVSGWLSTEDGSPRSVAGMIAWIDSVWTDEDGRERLGAVRRPVDLVDEGGGWFRVEVASEGASNCRRVLVITGRDEQWSLRAAVELPEPLLWHTNVGTIVATAPPIVCAGVVLDPAENPLDGCEIRCEPHGDVARSDRARLGEPAPIITRDGGRFQLRMRTEAKQFTLSATHPSFGTVRVADVALGTERAILRMRNATVSR